MKKDMWKPQGFHQALAQAAMTPEALAVKLQDLGWSTTIHTVLDWRSDRSSGPKHLVQVNVIAKILKCKASLLVKGGK